MTSLARFQNKLDLFGRKEGYCPILRRQQTENDEVTALLKTYLCEDRRGKHDDLEYCGSRNFVVKLLQNPCSLNPGAGYLYAL